jgi:FtsH-binding integral membrane protein
MLLGWLGTALANGDKPIGTQYAGLAIYVLAETIIFAPLFVMANYSAPGVIGNAAIISLVTFGGLSVYVLTTRQDFSFLRTGLVVGSLVALALIVLGCLFGFGLGTWFSGAMLLLACGAILYTTSNVLHQYRTDQYVAASLSLFAAVALLFWYVIRLLMQLRR